MDYAKFLFPMSNSAYSCNECFRPLKRGEMATDCADCGAVICESCVCAGRMDTHICEEDDDYEF